MPIYVAKHYIRLGRKDARIDVKPGEQYDFTTDEVAALKATEALVALPKAPKVAGTSKTKEDDDL
jgi:hypothetical protein